MRESTLTDKIKKALRQQRGGRWFKVHGSPYQEAGISDLVGCYQGKFYALEIKLPGKENTLTDLQKLFIEDVNNSGGKAAMITSVEEALNFVK